jgi:hypothetical protein
MDDVAFVCAIIAAFSFGVAAGVAFALISFYFMVYLPNIEMFDRAKHG